MPTAYDANGWIQKRFSFVVTK